MKVETNVKAGEDNEYDPNQPNEGRVRIPIG